jgi:hypothetical protein
LGVKEERGWFSRPSSVGETSAVFVALRYDPFVARRRLFLVDARTTTLLYDDELEAQSFVASKRWTHSHDCNM